MIKKVKAIWETKFGKDLAITIAGQIVVLLVAFGLNKLLSIRLGTVGYGEYSIARRTASVIAYVMLFGLGIAVPRYLAVFRQMGDKLNEARFMLSAISILIFLSSITIGILLAFRISLAQMIFGEISYSILILPMLAFAFSMAVTTFAYSFYRGLDKLYMYSVSQISVQLINLFLAFVFDKDVTTLLGVWSIVTGGYGIIICAKAWAYYYSKANIKSYIRDLRPQIGELTSFCLPRVPGEFILFAYTVLPLIIINHKLGMEITAFFAAATSVNSTISPMFSFVGVVLLPLVSKSLVNQQFDEAENKVKVLGKIYLILGILGIAFVEIFTPFVVKILFSKEYLTCVPIVRIMIFALLPNAYYLLLRNPLDAVSKIPYNTINLLISFVFLNVFIYFSSSTTAYAVSFVAAYILLGLLSMWSWHKCKKEIYQQRTIGIEIGCNKF